MKQFINGNTLANDSRMRRSIFKGAFLYVEGESDERLYSLFVEANRCQIIVAHGKEKLLEACTVLNEAQFEGFLGVMDADSRTVT